jgi:hypothetical protein
MHSKKLHIISLIKNIEITLTFILIPIGLLAFIILEFFNFVNQLN